MNETVCVLIWSKKLNKVLACSRKDNHNAWGLPGGKVETTDASSRHAAARELMEETLIDVDWLQEIFSIDYDGGQCTCYSVHPQVIPFLEVQELVSPPGEGLVAWRTPIDLVSGPFGEYNSKLFDHIGVNYRL